MTCRRVCKTWQYYISSEPLQTTIDLSPINKDVSDDGMPFAALSSSAAVRSPPRLSPLPRRSVLSVPIAVCSVTRFGGTQLRQLNMRNCWHVTDRALEYIGENAPLVETLDLNSCWEVTEGGVMMLSRACRRLRCLDLSNCKKARDFII